MNLPRRFMMTRSQSIVAEGVVFEDGATVLRWRGETKSTAVYESFETCKKIHGHEQTHFNFLDCEGEQSFLCCMCFSEMDPLIAHCFQCGAGNTDTPMSKETLKQVQLHDEQRLDAFRTLREEAGLLRQLLCRHVGVAALGLVAAFNGEEIYGAKQSGSNTTAMVRRIEGESVEDFLKRAVENIALDPKILRGMMSR